MLVLERRYHHSGIRRPPLVSAQHRRRAKILRACRRRNELVFGIYYPRLTMLVLVVFCHAFSVVLRLSLSGVSPLTTVWTAI